jgi:hypothetical protein
MANSVTTDLSLRVLVNEFLAGEMRTTKSPIVWPSTQNFFYASGTSASQCDLVYSDQGTATGAAVNIDLRGALASPVNGQTVIFAEVCFVGVFNRTSTSGYVLQVGGGATQIAIFGGTTPEALLGPSSLFVWSNWVDGVTVGAGTTDMLTLDPGANTIAYDVLIIGRSA